MEINSKSGTINLGTIGCFLPYATRVIFYANVLDTACLVGLGL